MTNPLKPERVSAWIVERPLFAFIVTSVLVVISTSENAIALAASVTHVTLATWLILGAMVYAIVVVAFLPKGIRPALRPAICWTIGISPALWGAVAVDLHSPLAVQWLGVVITLVLTGWVAFVSSRHPSSPD